MATPFEPAATQFSLTNALFLAKASDDAYASDVQLAQAVADLGLSAAPTPFHSNDTDSHGFVGQTDEFIVLAFRGTGIDSLKNWLSNDNVVQIPAAGGGVVHKGFANALQSVWQEVRAALPKPAAGQTLWVTGHSLGGALATLAGAQLLAEGFPVAAVYTYGSPRVGNAVFAEGYQPTYYRLVHNLDIVPHVPLGQPLAHIRTSFLNYQHTGTLKYLSPDGLRDEGPSDQDVFRQGLRLHLLPPQVLFPVVATLDEFFQRLMPLMPTGVADHAINTYIQALDHLLHPDGQ